MSTIRSSTASTVTNLLGTVSTTAAVLTMSIDSVGALVSAGHTKARYYAARVQSNAINQDHHYRSVDRSTTAMLIATHEEELLSKLETNPRLATLYAKAEAELASLHVPQ
jgi:hypothetical protein